MRCWTQTQTGMKTTEDEDAASVSRHTHLFGGRGRSHPPGPPAGGDGGTGERGYVRNPALGCDGGPISGL